MTNIIMIILMLILLRLTKGDVIATTAQGTIRGTSEDGYVSFIGIPYATLNGTTRFRTAGPAPTWKGMRQLHRERISCNPSLSSTEDCLQLDVHTPFGSTATPWPVLVWIPGGSGQYHPKALVNKGLIVVVVNYRIGTLGFLCINNENISGNAGVKDLVLALRWIRDNIPAFRGNPYKIIIAGQSFGAALVEALVISSMAKGLFHGAIMQSGSVLCPWAFNYDAVSRANALVTLLTESEDDDDITDALVQAKADDLMDKSNKLEIPYFSFAMCVDKPLKNKKAFMPEAPIRIMKKMILNIPIIVGYNSDEAYIFLSYLKKLKVLRKLRKDVSFLLPEDLIFRSEKEIRQVTRQVKEAYFSKNITLRALLAYHRDAYYLGHIHKSVALHSAINRAVYFYQFSYNRDLGVEVEDGLKKIGAAHSDELAYLFPEDGHDLKGDNKVVQDKLVQLWSNFVKFLNPTPSSADTVKWEPIKSSHFRLLDINMQVEMKDYPYSKTAELWDDIYDKYYYRRQN